MEKKIIFIISLLISFHTAAREIHVLTPYEWKDSCLYYVECEEGWNHQKCIEVFPDSLADYPNIVLYNDLKKEDMWTCFLIGKHGNMFYSTLIYDEPGKGIDNTEITGYIKKGSVFVYPRLIREPDNEAETDYLYIRNVPDIKADVISYFGVEVNSMQLWIYDFIVDKNNDVWFYVKFQYDSKEISGWVNEHNTCSIWLNGCN